MERRLFHEKLLYRISYGAVLACICLFTPALGFSDVTWKNICILSVVLALFAGMEALPTKRKALFLASVVLFLGVWAAIAGARTDFGFLRGYLRWCAGYEGAQAEWMEGFSLLQTAVVTVASLLIEILLERSRAIRLGSACACAIILLACLFAQVLLTHMGVVFALLYILMVYVEWMQGHWKKLLWLWPFLAAYLLLVAVMPAPEAPYDWQWAKDICSQIRESFLVASQNIMRSLHGGGEDFGTALSGFPDEGDLGEGVREDDREVMRIQSERNLVTNIYLTGRVYDTFDGRQWLQEYRGSGEERFLDALETTYAVRRLDEDYLSDYLRETKIRIRYGFFNTGYVFVPLKTRSIVSAGPKLEYSFEGGDLVMETRKGYGTEYDVMYCQLNAGTELFERLLEEETRMDPELWEMIANEQRRRTGEEITLEMLEAHRQAVYENYLGEVVLSEEAADYLSEMTGDAATSLERLRAIERELSSYTYTKTPGRLPEEIADAEDFLDYFLLESREGYCTYFATAFVLLARAEGIPARYVQGFCVPAGGERETAVLSSMAHSWPEAYIEGVGWIPFEPTPGYGALRYTPWGVRTRGDTVAGTQGGGRDEREPEGMPVALGEEPTVQEALDWSGLKRLVRVLVSGSLAVLGGLLLVLVVENLLGRYRYQKMDMAGRFGAEIRRNLRILSWLGLKREGQETLQELRERGSCMQELKGSLDFLERYEEVLYGGREATTEMYKGAEREQKQLLHLLREQRKLTYIFFFLDATFLFFSRLYKQGQ